MKRNATRASRACAKLIRPNANWAAVGAAWQCRQGSEQPPCLTTGVATSGQVCLAVGISVLEKGDGTREDPKETCQGFEASVGRLRDLGLFNLVK